MKKKFYLLLVVLCVGVTLVWADKYEACIVETTDGEIIECLADFNAKTLKYKTSKNSKDIVKIKRENVRFATFFAEDGTPCVVSGMPIVEFLYSARGRFDKQTQRRWIYFLQDPRNTDKVVMYNYTVVVNTGKMIIYEEYYGFYRNADGFGVDCYRPATISVEKYFKKIVTSYMEDCPDLVEYINDKQTKIKSLENVLNLQKEYNQCAE